MRNKLLRGAALLAGSLAFSGAAYAVVQPEISIAVWDNGVEVGAGIGPVAGGGPVTYTTSDAAFPTISVTSTGAPITPDPAFGTISINVSSSALSAATPHTLVLYATQVNLTGVGTPGLQNTFTYNGLLFPGNISTSIGQNYVDAGNSPFALTTLMASTPNEGGAVTYSSPVMTYSPTPGPLFSETEVYTLTFTGLAQAQSSAQIVGDAPVPEPFTLSLLGTGLLGLAAARARRRS